MAGMQARASSDFVGSFDKGLRVLRAFDAEHALMTLSEVAERTGLTRAAARRFLHTLVELGYARFDSKRFALTPRVLDLGYAYLRSLRLPDIVAPYLRRVSQQLQESASVAVLDGLEVVYVARVQTRRIMSADIGIGTRLPALHTSLGRVLLGQLPEAERERLIKRATPRRHTSHTVVSRPRLREILREVQSGGFALVDQELEEGLRSIAVPLWNRRGEPLAAMNVSGQANRLSPETMRREFLPVLLRTADELRGLLP